MSADKIRYRTFDEVAVECLRADPDLGCGYLGAALEEYENDHWEAPLLSSLRNVIDAQGGLSELAHKTGIAETELETALSEHGMKALKHFRQILEAFGYTLAFKPVEQEEEQSSPNISAGLR